MKSYFRVMLGTGSRYAEECKTGFAASWQSEHTSPILFSGLSGEMMQPPCLRICAWA